MFTAAVLLASLTYITSAQSAPGAHPQGNSEERTVTSVWKSMPVEVRAVKTKNKSTHIGRPVAEGNDWFDGLTLSVTNVTGKSIVYIRGGFLFPRPRHAANAEQPPKYQSFMYGQHPEASEAARLSFLPINLGPGESMDIMLGRSDYEIVKQRLKQIGYADSIKEIQLHLAEVYFDDGSFWVAGHTQERKPAGRENRQPTASRAVKKKTLPS
jgi:hypothetical protein